MFYVPTKMSHGINLQTGFWGYIYTEKGSKTVYIPSLKPGSKISYSALVHEEMFIVCCQKTQES